MKSFDVQHSIAVSARYGCFFAHPGSEEALGASYESCGYAPQDLGIGSRDGQVDAVSAQYQTAVTVHTSGISRRTFLLIIFLLKEASFITALAFLIVLFAIILPIVLVLMIPIYMYYLTVKSLAIKHARFMALLLMINDIICAQLCVVVVMCVNFSTTCHVYKLAIAVASDLIWFLFIGTIFVESGPCYIEVLLFKVLDTIFKYLICLSELN